MMDNVEPWFLLDILRTLFSLFDRVVYQLLVWIYEIFFGVAQQEIITSGTMTSLFQRIFLILGVFMMFKLMFSLLSAVVNPDALTDKEKGIGKITTRILTAIILLLTLLPTSINNPSSTYQKQINDNGLLFGTLYTLQSVVLQNNVLGKIILGKGTTPVYNGDKVDSNLVTSTGQKLSDAGNNVASTIYKAFFFPNQSCANPEGIDGLSVWNDSNANPQNIIDYVNTNCTGSDGHKRYAYSYMFGISALAGGFLVFVVFSFTLDVAIRSIKLAVLRLLSPIPIISYIDPKSAKDGSFAAWVKNLTSTFIDLFLRLVIIYFIIFLVVEMTTNKELNLLPKLGDADFTIKMFVFAFMVIGLFFFAKQAPKFIKDVLGIKGAGSGLGIGLSGILGGAAMVAGGGGLAGFALGATQGATMANDAIAQGKQAPGAWGSMRDQMAKIRTGDKDARGGVLGSFMDRQLYNTRERQLNKKGLSFANMQEAKQYSKEQASRAAQAQLERDLAWEKLKANGITSQPVLPNVDDYQTENGKDMVAYRSAYEQYEKNTALWNDFIGKDDALTVAQKAAKDASDNYGYAKDARKAMAVTPRLEDQYTDHGYRAVKNPGKFNPRPSENKQSIPDNLDDVGGFSHDIGGRPGGPPPRR